MNTIQQINLYLESLDAGRKEEMQKLHDKILITMSGCSLWFLDGKDENGKVISNPNIGYGKIKLEYKDGSNKDFYRIGISANTSGISVYFMGIRDKNFLMNAYGDTIGKAKITGYCIKFSSLKNIKIDALMEAIRHASALN